MDLGAIKMMPRTKRGPLEGRFHSRPPPSVKSRSSGGAEIHFGPLICGSVSEPQIFALFLSLIPDAPPSIKGRMDGGIQNPIQTVDLSVETWGVQMHTCIIGDSGPPPVRSAFNGGGGPE